jgi:hypothetical protein
VLSLKDSDIALVSEVMQAFHNTGALSLVENMGGRVQAYLEVELPEKMSMYKFLDTVLKDYSWLTTRRDTYL